MKRARRTALLAGTAALLPVAALGLTALATQANAATPAFPAHYSAPYLQIASSDVTDLTADMRASGDKYYSLAFLTPKSGCTPEWEDNGDTLGAFTSQVSALQAAGGNVIPSFGGAAGGELAQTCTSTSSLEAAYASVVNTYHVTRLDFDIEGSVLDDTASNNRRDQALAQLQRANPNVQIDFTVPVAPTGMESNATSMLQGARNAGVKVNLVNIMIMDFGNGQNPLTDGESAAKASVSQLQSIFGVSATQAWNMLGLTPIAGQNDDAENFTQADATTLENFAAKNGVQELAFWEVDQYDKPLGYAYSSTFNKITGGSTGSPSPTPSSSSSSGGGGGTIVGNNSGLCLSVTGNSTTLKATGDINTCDGDASEHWTVNSNGTIENANSLCLSVTGGSTTAKATTDVYTCNGSAPENWSVNSDGTITNNNSGLCLSVTGGATAPGSIADIYTCNGSASEHWTVH